MTEVVGSPEYRHKAKQLRALVCDYFNENKRALTLPKDAVSDEGSPLIKDGALYREAVRRGDDREIRFFQIDLDFDEGYTYKTGKGDVSITESDINPFGTFDRIHITVPDCISNFGPIFELYKRWIYDWDSYASVETSVPEEINVT